MPDPFSIRRQFDGDADDLAERLKARRRETIEAERERAKRLVRLRVGYYFDPVTREVLRKVGSQFVFVRHDRRRTNRSGNDKHVVRLKPIHGGLYWDAAAKAIYLFRNGQYVLYSKDRRKTFAPLTGKDRRKSK
jgi:hypothetical protein